MQHTGEELSRAEPRAGGGRDRAAFAGYLVERYAQGASLSRLSDDTGRSFGYVRRILIDAGVTMRPRGGSRPRRG